MKITVVGTGCMGLATAACFADTGNEGLCLAYHGSGRLEPGAELVA